ncbi:MAG: 4Fe-4S dicluster domain-containing protein [Deltaproteobacteria bacterium]|nr:4Fe-4S dicluster domain-containing protein [Deltaproteobacteria bacterium]
MGVFTFAAGITSTSLLNAFLADSANAGKAPIVINAKGVLLAEPSRCTGCRRCELACTEFNDGKSHPVISRIKVYRNYNFGPQGVQHGYYNGRGGKMGNMRVIQETCKQCPHPIPCADVCPRGAIEASPETNARVVNADRCTGCKICIGACPWAMIAYDPDTRKATKCFLCNGNPECVAACPNGAIKYLAWVDLTKQTAPRSAAYRKAPDDSCLKCH